MKGTRVVKLGKLVGLMSVVAIAATGCSPDDVLGFGWPQGITEQADQMRHLWTWSVIAALAVGLIVAVLILWPVVFHRKRGNELPKQLQYNHPLEIVYTIIPVIIVGVLFYFTATTENFVTNEKATPDVTVDVVAFQWNWEFDYPGFHTPDGNVVKTVGSSSEIPLLVLPSNKTVEYDLHSTDVIHSFWVPQFNFKRDVFPDPDKNNQNYSFQNVIDQQGSFVGRCAELCGTYHSAMNFEVRVLSPDLFAKYMALRTKVNAKTGQPYTAAEALSEMNCGDLCSPVAVTTHPFNTDRTSRNGS